MTYYFVVMLMYRGCLLTEFLRTAANTPRETAPILPVQKCVQAAIHMASFAADIAEDSTYNAVFWTTSYFTFCAISILVVYLTLYRNVDNRSQLEGLLDRAMKGHKRLDPSTEAQRLLEESHNLARSARSLTNRRVNVTHSGGDSTSVALPASATADSAQPTDTSVESMGQPASSNQGLESLYSHNDVFHDLVSDVARSSCARQQIY